MVFQDLPDEHDNRGFYYREIGADQVIVFFNLIQG
jgi:hypothetical protein